MSKKAERSSTMAYIPPHKRHSKDSDTPSPTPSLFHQKRNPIHTHSKILYAKGTNRWFVLPSINSDDSGENPQLPCSVQLKEFPYELLERRDGAKPMILVCKDHPHKEANEKADVILKAPWVSIEEKIQHDLINAFQIAQSEMCKDGPELNTPHFVIRFGKILFHGGPPVSLDDINEPSAVESILSRLKRRYNTNVPDSFVQAILSEFVPKVGLDFLGEKEYYHVTVFDKSRPDATISCRCRLREESGELDIYKIALNERRQLVVDISCLDKNLDLRLLLDSKRILVSLTDDEKDSLISLVKSAVIDSEVKGGLRWPLGKESLGDRYTVVGIWHAKAKTFRTSYARLRVRHADRFDFRASIGEVSQEASMSIPEIAKQSRDETLELEPLVGMGDIGNGQDILVRVHSECLTGDIFGSARCDCGKQLALPMGLIEEMLRDIGVRTMRLMTNNPAKFTGLKGYGLAVVGRVPVLSLITEENKRYLETKRTKMGHVYGSDLPGNLAGISDPDVNITDQTAEDKQNG